MFLQKTAKKVLELTPPWCNAWIKIKWSRGIDDRSRSKRGRPWRSHRIETTTSGTLRFLKTDPREQLYTFVSSARCALSAFSRKPPFTQRYSDLPCPQKILTKRCLRIFKHRQEIPQYTTWTPGQPRGRSSRTRVPSLCSWYHAPASAEYEPP